MRPTLGVLAAAIAGIAFGTLAAPPAQAAPDPACSGVWVVVAQEAARCATEHRTGAEALASAGFTVTEDARGLICRIDNAPAECRVTFQAYWSYWQATPQPDGTWGPWRYATLGYKASSPVTGDAEGWVFGDGRTPPPPLLEEAAPRTPAASGPASPSATPAGATSPSATSAGATPASATPAGMATGPTRPPGSGASATDVGSPVPTIAVGATVLAGSGALTGWWYRRGRR